VVMVALVVTATVRADMMRLSPGDAGCRPAARVCDQADLPPTDSPGYLVGLVGFADRGSSPVAYLPVAGVEGEQASEAQPVRLLAEGQGSLSLCLYGLIGLGAFRSGSWMKRLSFGVIPDWYHTGGPAQIGHSFAISPDCLCPTPVCCFVQPEGRADDGTPKYRQGTIVSLWRQSQFTPAVLASRGPPEVSHKETASRMPVSVRR
jgi:hypothetical protein